MARGTIRIGISGWRYAPWRGVLRLHGDTELYASGHGETALDDWARRIEARARCGEVDDARRVSPEPARWRPDWVCRPV